MKLLVAVAALLAVAHGARNVVPLVRAPSRMEQLMAAGEWQNAIRMYNVRKAMAAAANDTQPQTDIYNTFYLGKVDVGTPKQTFTVVMDTGSSDFWVTDKTFSGGSGKHKFDSSKSSTYKSHSGHWVIHYGSGSASGFEGEDVVCFTDTDYCYDKQIFGQATQEGVQAQQPIDGILGLAFETISSIKTPQPWANIIAGSNPPPHPWYTFWLEDLNGSPHGQVGGQITFGDYDKQHCSSTCDWIPLSHELWFEFEVDSIGAGSHKSGKGSVISDTGTSFIIGPENDINAIGRALGATFDGSMGLWKIACDRGSDKQSINVMINGKNYPITAKNYVVSFDNDATCYVAMAGGFLGNPQWILGDTFIREYCNSYDLVGKRVGLCKAN